MTNNKIQMPANFVALNENEMSCVEGGGSDEATKMRGKENEATGE